MNRLHPLSAVSTSLRLGIQIASIPFTVVMFLNFITEIDFMYGLYLFPVGFVGGVGYGLAHYRLFRYDLTPDTFDVESGVINRQERDVPYHRIQNVDVHQSLSHRLFDMAVVSVETAGGSQTEIELDFVSKSEADRLQSAIREHKRDTTSADGSESADDTTSSSAQPTALFELTLPKLLVLALTDVRGGSAMLSAIALIGVRSIAERVVLSVAQPFGGPTSLALESLTPDNALVLLVVSMVSACLWIWLVNAFLVFVGQFGFVLGRAGEDLLYEFGLLNRSSGSIPQSKIQTLTLTEPVLARLIGWAGLKAETAGYAPGGDGRGGTDYVVPIAPREQTLRIATAIESFETPAINRPPKIARRRYAARYSIIVSLLTLASYLVGAVVGGFELWYAPALLFVLVPFGAHAKWANRGYRIEDDHIIVRDGFWRRTTRIVPYHRLQTIRLQRSVFQRRLGLADLTADTASATVLFSNDATAFDITLEDARTDADRWREQFRAALER
ncbi:PH domain-containing protein [Halocatena halophila]|uniref:PH domain-containing protein n=1 Tax=Halocatena halophila TaxID=2814576 RepID=UPI002ED3C57C